MELPNENSTENKRKPKTIIIVYDNGEIEQSPIEDLTPEDIGFVIEEIESIASGFRNRAEVNKLLGGVWSLN